METTTPYKTVAAFSAAGIKHQRKGQRSQDKVGVYSDQHIAIAVVSDGCSSCAHSRIGAATVVYTAINFGRNHLMARSFYHFDDMKQFVNELLAAIRVNLVRMSQLQSIPTVAELSSTMIFTAFYKNRYITVQLGDGAVIIQKGDGSIKKLDSKHPIQAQQNVTYSTQDLFYPNFSKAITVSRGSATGALLMTDGLSPIYRVLDPDNMENIHIMFFINSFYSRQESRKAMEEISKICAGITFDDTTIACVSSPGRDMMHKLSDTEKHRCLNISSKSSKLYGYITMYNTFKQPQTVREAARLLNIPTTRVTRMVKHLAAVGLLSKTGNKQFIHAYLT